jgi:hypothetical protein
LAAFCGHVAVDISQAILRHLKQHNIDGPLLPRYRHACYLTAAHVGALEVFTANRAEVVIAGGYRHLQ